MIEIVTTTAPPAGVALAPVGAGDADAFSTLLQSVTPPVPAAPGGAVDDATPSAPTTAISQPVVVSAEPSPSTAIVTPGSTRGRASPARSVEEAGPPLRAGVTGKNNPAGSNDRGEPSLPPAAASAPTSTASDPALAITSETMPVRVASPEGPGSTSSSVVAQPVTPGLTRGPASSALPGGEAGPRLKAGVTGKNNATSSRSREDPALPAAAASPLVSTGSVPPPPTSPAPPPPVDIALARTFEVAPFAVPEAPPAIALPLTPAAPSLATALQAQRFEAVFGSGEPRDWAKAFDAGGSARVEARTHALGAVGIEIARAADGLAVTLRASGEESRAALVDAQPRLLADVRAAGVALSQSRVDDAPQRETGREGEREPHPDARQPHDRRAARHPRFNQPAGTTATSTADRYA